MSGSFVVVLGVALCIPAFAPLYRLGYRFGYRLGARFCIRVLNVPREAFSHPEWL